MTFEETILAVYYQALVDKLKVVTLGDETYSIRTTAKQELKQIDFSFDGRDLPRTRTESQYEDGERKAGRIWELSRMAKSICTGAGETDLARAGRLALVRQD